MGLSVAAVGIFGSGRGLCPWPESNQGYDPLGPYPHPREGLGKGHYEGHSSVTAKTLALAVGRE